MVNVKVVRDSLDGCITWDDDCVKLSYKTADNATHELDITAVQYTYTDKGYVRLLTDTPIELSPAVPCGHWKMVLLKKIKDYGIGEVTDSGFSINRAPTLEYKGVTLNNGGLIKNIDFSVIDTPDINIANAVVGGCACVTSIRHCGTTLCIYKYAEEWLPKEFPLNKITKSKDEEKTVKKECKLEDVAVGFKVTTNPKARLLYNVAQEIFSVFNDEYYVAEVMSDIFTGVGFDAEAVENSSVKYPVNIEHTADGRGGSATNITIDYPPEANTATLNIQIHTIGVASFKLTIEKDDEVVVCVNVSNENPMGSFICSELKADSLVNVEIIRSILEDNHIIIN